MRFDGGRVCLDLVGAADEGLPDTECLAEWLYGSGLVPDGVPLTAAPDWLPRFAALRDLLGRLVTAQVDGPGPSGGDIAALNGFALPAPPVPAAVIGAGAVRAGAGDGESEGDAEGTGDRLSGNDGDGAVLRRALATPPTCEALLSAVARDAVDLFTDAFARGRLRRCEGEQCTRIYLDTSRGRRRRWCSSEICGNRERVARHRRRSTSKETADPEP